MGVDGRTETPSAPSGRAQLARRAGVVSAAVALSRVLGVVREQAFAIFFGAGRELDAFITAFRIPNLMRDLFAEGALSAAFVSTFTQQREREGDASAWRLASQVINALLLVVGTIVVLGIVWAPQLASLIAPGFEGIPGKLELTVHLARVMWPFLLLVALAAVAMGILNARQIFGVPALAAAFFNVGSIVGGLSCAWWLAPDYMSAIAAAVWHRTAMVPRDTDAATRAITGMAIGTLAGGALQFLVQLPALRATGYRFRFGLDWRDPGLRRVLRLMGPATIGAAAVQINVFINNNFASYLGDGPVSWLNVAFRFMQLPIGLFGVAIGTVTLPEVSRQAARGETDGLRRTLRDALLLLATLCLPAAALLHVFRVSVIGLLYEHGRFHSTDTLAAAAALSAYAVGLAGYAGIKVLLPAFYALNDARTPALISLLSIATNYALNWTLTRHLGFGHVGLALSTSAVATVNFLLLYTLLRRRIGSLGSDLVATVARLGLAVAIMGAVCTVIDAWLADRFGPHGAVSYGARLLVGGGSGAALFWGACVVLRVPVPRWRRR